MSKQDRQGVRTAADLERKWNFGKSFAEAIGIAEEARKLAEDANESYEGLDSEAIFNLLTNNGELQGLYRGDDGELYINAKYIVAIEELFTKDIKVGGAFTNTAEVYVPPAYEEIALIKNYILDNTYIPTADIPLYDVNGDGKIDIVDLAGFRMLADGTMSMAEWSGAKKTKVTVTVDVSNPNECIRIEGVNMWGRQVVQYIGIDGTNMITNTMADYVVEQGLDVLSGWHFCKWNSGKAECWKTVSYNGTITTQVRNLTYDSSGASTGYAIAGYASDNISEDFPASLFATVPHIFVSPIFGTLPFEIRRSQWSYATEKTTSNYQIITPSAVTTTPNEAFRISFYAIGTWA